MARKTLAVFRTKLGAAKREPRSRIWLEGQRLIDAGFTVGKYFAKDWDDDAPKFERPLLELTLAAENDVFATTPCKVSGKGGKPIIDITGAAVRDVFGRHGDHVDVQFYPGRIVITRTQARFDDVVKGGK